MGADVLGRVSRYRFLTHWRVEANIQDVSDILSEPTDLPRWWPDVYLSVVELRAGGVHHVGRRLRLHTKGWLPYTLTWEFEVIEATPPYGSRLRAIGDFDGEGVWRFRQDGPIADITFEWSVQARKPLLRWTSVLLRPVFAANHRWAMARGRESLVRELARRTAGATGAAGAAGAAGATGATGATGAARTTPRSQK